LFESQADFNQEPDRARAKRHATTKMNITDISGVIVPSITPVDAYDRLDEQAFRLHLSYLVDAGVHGIFVAGTAGEGPLLTFREWQRTLEVACEVCHGKTLLLGGALDTSTARVIERVHVLAAIGYQNFVVAPPFYLKLRFEEEHLRFFSGCLEAGGDMNMIPYNIPSCTGSVIPVSVMYEMVSRGWINSCKESSENLTYLSRLLTRCQTAGLRVLIGTELNAMAGLLMGAQGLVPACANFEPGTFTAAYDARNDPQRLGVLQDRMTKLVLNVVLGPRSWLAGVKYAASRRRGLSDRPISPTEPLNSVEQGEIDSFLAKEY